MQQVSPIKKDWWNQFSCSYKFYRYSHSNRYEDECVTLNETVQSNLTDSLNQFLDRQTNKQTNKQKDTQTDRQTNKQKDTQTDRQAQVYNDEWMCIIINVIVNNMPN